MPSIDTIVFVDPDNTTISLSQRREEDWTDALFASADIALPSLGLTIPFSEVFATD